MRGFIAARRLDHPIESDEFGNDNFSHGFHFKFSKIGKCLGSLKEWCNLSHLHLRLTACTQQYSPEIENKTNCLIIEQSPFTFDHLKTEKYHED